MKRRTIGIHEKLPLAQSLPLSLQHLTAMFGATILVPILLGINPAIALLMNGIGTLIYSWVTKGGIPAYLGSSFAFIAPVLLIISNHGGFAHAQSGFIFFGLFFILMSWVVYKWGIRWIDVVMPPAVMGGITMLLYGVIAVQGFRIFVEQKVDFSKNSNMVLGAITFVIGVSGASIMLGSVQLKGMAFAAIVGVVLSLLFWGFKKLHWLNE